MSEHPNSSSPYIVRRLLKTSTIQQSLNLNILRTLLKVIETLPDEKQKEFESSMNTLIEQAQQLQKENRELVDALIKNEGAHS